MRERLVWELTGGHDYCDGCRSVGAPCATDRPQDCRRISTIPETRAGQTVAALLTRSLLRADNGSLTVDVLSYMAACRAAGLEEGDALWFLPWLDAALGEVADARRDP